MAATSPLISCSKKATQDVDYSQSIRQIIASTYQESPETYAEEIASLNRCRQDALRGAAGSDVTARDLLYRYFGQLELLELRFPDLRVPFPWSDAFTTKQISQLSLAYEKASVIFNIAATLSALAAAQNRSSPEGLKRSFNFFRQSAGMYTYINENFLHAPSTDLSKDVVKTLVTLMLAQATEVFLERMSEEKKGAGLKARVCAQAGSLYHSMQDDAKDFVGKGWFSRSWSILIQCKSAYFESLAQYHRAAADVAASRHGDSLTRLKIASEKAKEASRLANGFASVFAPALVPTLPSDSVASLNELTKQQLALAGQALTTAQKNNDLIYHESPSLEAALPVIEKTSVAEPVPIQEVYGSPEVQKTVGTDLFIKLVPLAVHESASLYSEEKAKMVRAQAEAADLADGELAAALEYMGLPGSLARFKSGLNAQQQQSAMADPGPQVKGYVQDVAAEERTNRTQAMLDSLQQLKTKVAAVFESLQRDLDSEERECESARGQYADAGFEQAPSSSQNEFRGLRADIKSRREAISSASTSDETVFQLWQTCTSDVELLSDQSGDRVDDLFARELAQSGSADSARNLIDADFGGDDDAGNMQSKVSSIEENLEKLREIQRERVDVLKDLKERAQADDISHILILNRKTANIEPTLFASELEKFRGHQTRIAATIHHQHATLQQITDDFKGLTEGKKAKEIQISFQRVEKRRKELIARFQRAHEAFKEARSGAAKGIQFYRDLSEHASELRQSVNKYVSNRRSERNASIAHAKTSQRIDSAGADQSLNGIDFGQLDLNPSKPSQSSDIYRQPSYPSRPNPPAQVPTRPPVQPQYSTQFQQTPAPSYAQPPMSPSYSQQPQYPNQSSSALPPPSRPIQQTSLPPPSQPVSYNSYGGPQSTAYNQYPSYQPGAQARQTPSYTPSQPIRPQSVQSSSYPQQPQYPQQNQYQQQSQYTQPTYAPPQTFSPPPSGNFQQQQGNFQQPQQLQQPQYNTGQYPANGQNYQQQPYYR